MSRWLKRRGILLALLAVGGCLSPTLPLPPPDAPVSITELTPQTEGGESTWIVRGACTPGTIVLVENLETGRIDGVEDDDFDGRYSLVVTAKRCARADVWLLFEDTQSSRTGFLVAPTTNGTLVSNECASP